MALTNSGITYERNNYVIDYDRRIVWVRIPRTATSNMRKAFDVGNKLGRSMSIEKALKVDPYYYTIAFVRNPLTRFVSALRRVAKPIVDPLIYLDYTDKHFRPQWTFLEGLTVDFIGRFENMHEDWEKLRQMFDYPIIPGGPRNNKYLHLTDEQIKKIKAFYAKDYEMFGYVSDR